MQQLQALHAATVYHEAAPGSFQSISAYHAPMQTWMPLIYTRRGRSCMWMFAVGHRQASVTLRDDEHRMEAIRAGGLKEMGSADLHTMV